MDLNSEKLYERLKVAPLEHNILAVRLGIALRLVLQLHEVQFLTHGRRVAGSKDGGQIG